MQNGRKICTPNDRTFPNSSLWNGISTQQSEEEEETWIFEKKQNCKRKKSSGKKEIKGQKVSITLII